VAQNTKASTLIPFINENVDKDATVYTDEYASYTRITLQGFKHHHTVCHSTGEYVRGLAHTNSIEGFWSQLKRSIHGTYHAVSPKYLQAYVDEFAYRYNHRKVSEPLFYGWLNGLYSSLNQSFKFFFCYHTLHPKQTNKLL
jgi:transposase